MLRVALAAACLAALLAAQAGQAFDPPVCTTCDLVGASWQAAGSGVQGAAGTLGRAALVADAGAWLAQGTFDGAQRAALRVQAEPGSAPDAVLADAREEQRLAVGFLAAAGIAP